MNRREFIHASTVAVLVAQGHMPLLAAEKKRRRKTAGGRMSSQNIFTEPCAIEPVTGYLPEFAPVQKGSMTGDFKAKYTLVATRSSAGDRSRNTVTGEIEVSFSGAGYRTSEQRAGFFGSRTECEVKCDGALNKASSWTFKSVMDNAPVTSFSEKGMLDGKTMVVKSRDWTQKHATSNPLIGRWALLPLIASGKLKKKPLKFDMLDDSTLRPDQELMYAGAVEIPVKGGTVRLDSYVQTGWGIVPTHYLVDAEGRVQLITASQVSWALAALA